MRVHASLLWILPACVGAILMVVTTSAAAADIKACDLLTPSELEAVLGAKVILKSDGTIPGGKTEHCTGQAPAVAVMLRLVTGLGPGKDHLDSKEKKDVEMAKSMGGKVEVKSFGPVTCSSILPSVKLTQVGYNTTCTVEKDTAVAAIEVTAKNRKDMISIEKLRPLAEKMAGRF